jgi:hypothetical protein
VKVKVKGRSDKESIMSRGSGFPCILVEPQRIFVREEFRVNSAFAACCEKSVRRGSHRRWRGPSRSEQESKQERAGLRRALRHGPLI